METMITLIVFLWGACYWVQVFFGFGTAYRYAKRGGDNGVALFGWFCVFSFSAIVPGLGIYFWDKTRKEEQEAKKKKEPAATAQPQIIYITQAAPQEVASAIETEVPSVSASVKSEAPSEPKLACPKCGHDLPLDSKFCEYCGAPLDENATSDAEA